MKVGTRGRGTTLNPLDMVCLLEGTGGGGVQREIRVWSDFLGEAS